MELVLRTVVAASLEFSLLGLSSAASLLLLVLETEYRRRHARLSTNTTLAAQGSLESELKDCLPRWRRGGVPPEAACKCCFIYLPLVCVGA